MITFIFSLIICSWTIQSNNGQYTGEVIYTGGAELVTVSFTLYNEGEKLYSISKPDAITFFINNSGSVFAANERELFRYDLTGKISFLKILNYPNGFGFSPDNSLFFASDKDALSAYKDTGSLAYSFAPGRLFACTGNAERTAVVSNDTLFVYEKEQLKFARTLQTPYVRSLNFENPETIIIEQPAVIEIFNAVNGEKMEGR